MKIYTKTGDKGQTSLFDGTRVPKDNIRVETYGTIDELNSSIGVALAQLPKLATLNKMRIVLKNIQHDLFEIGAVLANPQEEPSPHIKQALLKHISSFENFIDEMTNELPELMNFILPGGSVSGANLQLTRAVSRRVERNVIALSKQERVEREIIMYCNRLSDLLFTMSRFCNFKEGKKETPWEKQLG